MDIMSLMFTPLHFKLRGSMRNLYETTMPLWSLIKGIQDNTTLAETTRQGRELRKQNKDEFKKWKPKNLMSIYLGVTFGDMTGRAKADNVKGYTGLAGFDFDDVNVAETLKLLQSVPQVICAGVSISGVGVWCAAHVAAATETEYLSCFAEGIRVFKEVGITGIDTGAHDPTRARFVASDPECWWRWDCDEIPPFMPVGDWALLTSTKKKRKKRIKIPDGYVMSKELAYDEAKAIIGEADEIEDGERNNAKARQIGKLKALAERAKVPVETYVQPFMDKWDEVGSTHKKTVSMVNRLMLNGEKKER